MPQPISLHLQHNSENYAIPAECIIGRHPGCDICVSDTSVSKQHCQIVNFWLQDLGSTNGTQLNGVLLPTDRKVQIKHGDVIVLGDATLNVQEETDKNRKEQDLNRSKRFMRLPNEKKNSGGKKVINRNGRLEQSCDNPTPKEDKEDIKDDGVEDADDGLSVEEIMEREFNNIIGHDQIKVQLKTFYKKVQLDQIRQAAGKSASKKSLYHMMFLGPPGTGKTTMANLVAKIMVKMKLIQNDKVVFVNNALDLLAGYSGQTPAKVDEKVNEAKGGVLFIDEAYSIVKEKHQKDSFGKEAIETIMKHLDPPSCVFIFAGYEEQMEGFLKVNQGLARRIPYRYIFEPYNPNQLMEIMNVMCSIKGEMVSEDVMNQLSEILDETSLQQRETQNAGLIDNWIAFAQMARDYRIDIDEARQNPDIASTLELIDFKEAIAKVKTQAEKETI